MAEASSHSCFQQPPPHSACGEAHQDSDDIEFACFYGGFAEPHAECAEKEADFEALNVGPQGKSADPNAAYGAEYPYPHGDLHEESADSHGGCGHFAYPNGEFTDPNAELSAKYAYPCAEISDLQEESADPNGNYGDFVYPNGDPADPYADDGDSACPDGGFVDPCEESADPHGEFEDSDEDYADSDEDYVSDENFVEPDFIRTAHLTSISKPSSSRCSSASSIVYHAASESTSRSHQPDMNTESLKTLWTDDKHRSYLTFMEANFVKNLYHREYCALDVCGQVPCHRESNSHLRLPEFKSWQNGDWQWRSMSNLLIPPCVPSALLRNPWVNHSQHHTAFYAGGQIKAKNASSFPDMEEGEEVDSPVAKSSQAVPHVVQERISCHQSGSSSKMGLEDKENSSKFHDKNGDAETDTLKQQVLQAVGHKTPHLTSFLNTKKRGLQADSEQRRAYTRQKSGNKHWDSCAENAM